MNKTKYWLFLFLIFATRCVAATEIVPDRFLRRWEPVTFFFAIPKVKAAGAEDHPEKFVKMTPAHAGAWEWMDASTLQFRPADPWPPLSRFHWTVDGQRHSLFTLMSPPSQTLPHENEQGLDPVESITLTFPEPIAVSALAEMLRIELRPLPGIREEAARILSPREFSIKEIDRANRNQPSEYVIRFLQPIPYGTRVVVRFRLALDSDRDGTFAEFSFATAEPFEVVSAGCYNHRFRVAPSGSQYTADRAVACSHGTRAVVVEFSAPIPEWNPIEARNLVRISPSVDQLQFHSQGRTLQVTGNFSWDTIYQITIVPSPVKDQKQRLLHLEKENSIHLYFPRKASYLKVAAGEGIIERFGPQMIPLKGRGQERIDLRIHEISPTDRSFWPFPDQPVAVDELPRPPGPGEEPSPFLLPDRNITANELVPHIRNLRSPRVSTIVPIPLRKEGSSARFGLDLKPHLQKNKPGTYLIGIRRIDTSTQRHWMRIQATDLSLSTLEEPTAVRFVVTSLSSAKPIPGATITLEGTDKDLWIEFAEGATDQNGLFYWKAPGKTDREIRRIIIRHGEDTLVLDPVRPPEKYADNQWLPDRERWLQWAFHPLESRLPPAETLCHIFTERPVYRPGETVHIKGYVRSRKQGLFSFLPVDGSVVVEGPGGIQYRYKSSTNDSGSFYHSFQESQTPTGEFFVSYEDIHRNRLCQIPFRIEAYRVPTFEVQLHAANTVALDREFEIKLTASYYAGGNLSGQKIEWRVTQFPYTWSPAGYRALEGFAFSSDSRYSAGQRFESTPRLEQQDVTNQEGGAVLQLNPAIEPNSLPRSYVVEATVTGPDDQTVTATKRIHALPAFVLGLQVPRYLEPANQLEGKFVVVSPEGKFLKGQEVYVRLLKRQWHSVLLAGDFTEGTAKYKTDVVDEKVYESHLVSLEQASNITFPLSGSGVYVAELESRDRQDRAQVVSVDFYLAGSDPVAWQKPVSPVFSATPDQENYDPGQTASIVLKSPFQKAEALAIVETPDGNQYSWVTIEGGAATFRLKIKNLYSPKIPVHFLLYRGRIPTGTGEEQNDLGKPSTMASTVWLKVNPVENLVAVKLEYPEKARPGDKIQIRISLSGQAGTSKNAPLPGEVTLWLVDEAVLALGKEQRLDPIPDFVTARKSFLSAHDTRNLAFGHLPFAEAPGGDESEKEADILERATVRRNFQSVPYYNHSIAIGTDGSTTVAVTLPDNLTNFKIRVKAVSGPDRFGYGSGQISVRIPLLVQPALPRFVRPGDSFSAAAITRVLEGPDGAGAAEIQAIGASVQGSKQMNLSWEREQALRIEFPVQIETPPYNKFGNLSYNEVTLRMGVRRLSDKVSDAFEVKLPLREDRRKEVERKIVDLHPGGKSFVLPAIPEAVRPGSVRRSVLVSQQPALIKMAAGLDFLLEYPHGCTEQRISRARSYIALKEFRDILRNRGGEQEINRAVQETLEWIPGVCNSGGVCSYWPGSQGYVSLTAWVVQFLVEARRAGFNVDERLLNTLTDGLERSLRSDSRNFITGEAFAERTWALAALADAGKFQPSYAAELAHKSKYLDLESVAEVLAAFARSGDTSSPTVRELSQELWNGLVIRLYQGNEVYGGLENRRTNPSALILPCETRTLSEVTRALTKVQAKDKRLPILIQALVTLGKDNGWGTTNANAAALLALSETMRPGSFQGTEQTVFVTADGQKRSVQIGRNSPLATIVYPTQGPLEILLDASGKTPVAVRAETRYIPKADGSHTTASAQGLPITRELLRVISESSPLEKLSINQPGKSFEFFTGDITEEHVQVVNPKERHYVAIVVPIAAGMEPLNPNLATASPEAKCANALTLAPSYTAYLDDSVTFYFDTLPKGTFDFYFRTRATFSGDFIQPAASAEMMYDESVRGNTPGARIRISSRK